mmetsp:Transcript_23307/g.56258  ORF Transcript_23307/g.56258 Transcript_23307/m.56258 type:complete len:404 (+) Transcript_23307:576-1787(+)
MCLGVLNALAHLSHLLLQVGDLQNELLVLRLGLELRRLGCDRLELHGELIELGLGLLHIAHELVSDVGTQSVALVGQPRVIDVVEVVVHVSSFLETERFGVLLGCRPAGGVRLFGALLLLFLLLAAIFFFSVVVAVVGERIAGVLVGYHIVEARFEYGGRDDGLELRVQFVDVHRTKPVVQLVEHELLRLGLVHHDLRARPAEFRRLGLPPGVHLHRFLRHDLGLLGSRLDLWRALRRHRGGRHASLQLLLLAAAGRAHDDVGLVLGHGPIVAGRRRDTCQDGPVATLGREQRHGEGEVGHGRILSGRALLGNDPSILLGQEVDGKLPLFLGPSAVVVLLAIEARIPRALDRILPSATGDEVTCALFAIRAHDRLGLGQFLHQKDLRELPQVFVDLVVVVVAR